MGRGLGLRHQHGGVVGVGGEGGVADHGLDAHLVAAEQQRLLERLGEAAGHALDHVGGRVAQVGEQHAELGRAGAGEHVGGAQHVGDAHRQRGEQVGAGQQPQVHDDHAGARAAGAGERELDVLLEQRRGRQAGQRVAQRGRALAHERAGELAAGGGEHRLGLGVVLADVAGEQLEHAGDVLALAERDGDGGAQARVARGAGARLLGVGAHVGDPRRAAEGEDAAGQAAAGGEAQAARALGEGVDGGPGVGGDPGGAAAQRRPVALGQPDGAAGEAERLAERAEHALHQALGALAVGEVVGDRLLGEQQPVRLALGAAGARGVELALERLGDLAGPGGDGDARPRGP